MADRVSLQSTTDSQAEVDEALGLTPTPDAPAAPEATTPAAEEPTTPPAPDAPAAAEPETEPEADDTADDDEAEDPDDAAVSDAARTLAQRKLTAKERINRLVREKSATKRELQKAREELAALQARLQTTPDTPKPAETPKVETPAPAGESFTKPRPTQDAFEDFDKYLEARDEWVAEKAAFDADQRYAAREKAQAEAKAKADAEAAQKARTEALVKRITAFKAEHPDYDEVMNASSVDLPRAVLDYMQESEVGPALAYHLGQHAEEAERLSTLSPTAALVQLGKLEAALTATAAAPAPPEKPARVVPHVPVSKAPAPVTTVGTGSTAPVGGSKDPNKMTQAEYNAWRDEEDRRKARAS